MGPKHQPPKFDLTDMWFSTQGKTEEPFWQWINGIIWLQEGRGGGRGKGGKEEEQREKKKMKKNEFGCINLWSA